MTGLNDYDVIALWMIDRNKKDVNDDHDGSNDDDDDNIVSKSKLMNVR